MILNFLQVRNDKARKYLTDMRKKQPVPFSQKFPNADPLGLRLLQRLLSFDPKDRPTAEEVGATFSTCFHYFTENEYCTAFVSLLYAHFCLMLFLKELL